VKNKRNFAPVVSIGNNTVKLRVKSPEHGARLLAALIENVEHGLDWKYTDNVSHYVPDSMPITFDTNFDLGTPPQDRAKLIAEAEALETRAAELRKEAQ
jgi:hypothetical protein